MNLEIIKKLRRNICKTVGHSWKQSYPNQICTRCKKKENLIWTVSEPTYIGCFPKREDIPVQLTSEEPIVGDIKYDMEQLCIMLYDGKNWVTCK